MPSPSAVTLRLNTGSFRVITKVFAFDQETGQVLVERDDKSIGEVTLAEVEALDGNRQFLDTEQTVRRFAKHVVRRTG